MGPWIVSSCNPCQIIQTTLVNHMTVAMQSTPLPFGFFVQECRLAKWFDFGFNVFWRLCFQFECVLLCASCLTQVCLHVKQVCSWGLGRGTACSRQRQWVQDVSWAIPACIGTIPHCNQSWILWRRHLDCSFYFFALFRFTCFFVVRHVCITFFVSDMWLEVTHWNDIRCIAEAAQETANEFNWSEASSETSVLLEQWRFFFQSNRNGWRFFFQSNRNGWMIIHHRRPEMQLLILSNHLPNGQIGMDEHHRPGFVVKVLGKPCHRKMQVCYNTNGVHLHTSFTCIVRNLFLQCACMGTWWMHCESV